MLAGGFGAACGDFRASFHSLPSQIAISHTARQMYAQGTPQTAVCPYECTREVKQHAVREENERNLLAGIGLEGEGFAYPGKDESRLGFSRFRYTTGSARFARTLQPLHMSRSVSLEACHEIVQRHQLLAPHAVWLVDQDVEARRPDTDPEWVGDCGLFLATRSMPSAQLWRAFYEYARFITHLGHFESVRDSDIVAASVHSASEGRCQPGKSRACVWWSEFDLDDEAYSCRPRRDASNVVTPAVLLATLANGSVAYPPPLPPPPQPPESPPPPAPSPNELRCELSAIASTDGYKVLAPSANGVEGGLVQKKCWRWDADNNWPPYVAHRDLYEPQPRCGVDRSRDVQWEGGFRQSLMAKGAFDPFHQNNDDCPYRSMVGEAKWAEVHDRLEDGVNCKDSSRKSIDLPGDYILKGEVFADSPRCELGTNLQSCGVHRNLVVFGYAFTIPVGADDLMTCTSIRDGTQVHYSDCADGGPGSIGQQMCYYGTHPVCGKRRFAFDATRAGPDVPDNSCGRQNGICEDGLMWSVSPPGKNECEPNTDARCNECRTLATIARAVHSVRVPRFRLTIVGGATRSAWQTWVWRNLTRATFPSATLPSAQSAWTTATTCSPTSTRACSSRDPREERAVAALKRSGARNCRMATFSNCTSLGCPNTPRIFGHII